MKPLHLIKTVATVKVENGCLGRTNGDDPTTVQ